MWRVSDSGHRQLLHVFWWTNIGHGLNVLKEPETGKMLWRPGKSKKSQKNPERHFHGQICLPNIRELKS